MSESLVTPAVKPRLAFLGVGWIGLNRMQAILEDGCAEAALVADTNRSAARDALDAAPSADVCEGLDEVLDSDADAVVIATPSGLHAEQAICALDAGKAVFCQKPLGRTADETAAVIDAARRNDRLLGIDLSYRHTRAMQEIRRRVQAGEIGRIYAADLTFHNAYGPGKGWETDPRLSGGGCLIDLGIHLVDLLLWTLDGSEVRRADGALYRHGTRLDLPTEQIEDYAAATLELSDGATARLACSWHHGVGQDATIEAFFHGEHGTLAFLNVDGSFYDFRAELRSGADRQVFVEPPDSWGGRAAIQWAGRLAEDASYDASIASVHHVAHALDQVYGR